MSDLTPEIKKVVEEKLIDTPPDVKDLFPTVLKQKNLSWITFRDENYIILSFLEGIEKDRIKRFTSNNYHPFPGLVVTEKTEQSAFHFENSFNIYLKGNKVRNAYSLSLGPDSTITLEDHHQTIKVKEFGNEIDYKISLAFIISFGEEIKEYNFSQYLKEIVSYSINQWRESYDH